MNLFHRPPVDSSKKLLEKCKLPFLDLKSSYLDDFLGCGSSDNLHGIVGIERFGSVALLRSLAVDESARGLGCAKALVLEIEKYAKVNEVSNLYLLTTTAEKFFIKIGYIPIERSLAPEAIRDTKEFSGLCPSSAVLMMKRL